MTIRKKFYLSSEWDDYLGLFINKWTGTASDFELSETLRFCNGFLNDYHLNLYISDRSAQTVGRSDKNYSLVQNIMLEVDKIKAPYFAFVAPDTEFFSYMKGILRLTYEKPGQHRAFKTFTNPEAAMTWIKNLVRDKNPDAGF